MTVYSFQNVPVYSPTDSSELQTLTVSGLTGLVGRNGAGKTRLLSWLHGKAEGGPGTGFLPQILEEGSSTADVARLLGIGPIIAAAERLGSGSGTEQDLELLEGKWDIPEKARALLDRIGLSALAFDRPEATLSGGQQVLVRFAAIVLKEPDLLLLDEPTNNLDHQNRERLITFLLDWKQPALIASHDRELLAVMDQIVEIEAGRLIHYGGGFNLYWSAREASFSEADRMRELARRQMATVQREKQIRSERAAKRAVIGKKQRATGSQPKVAADWKKNRAGSNLSRSSALEEARLHDASEALIRAREMRTRGDQLAFRMDAQVKEGGSRLLALEQISFTWPGAARPVFEDLSLFAPGGARLALEAENGRGKSTLLQIIAGNLPPQAGRIFHPSGRKILIDQHCRQVDRGKTVLGQFADLALPNEELRQGLAQFLFKGDILNRDGGSLSGGEILRLAFALAFIGQETPVLLLLDEPTNHVDLETVGVLERALSSYEGTLIVASHDSHFKNALGLEKFLFDEAKI